MRLLSMRPVCGVMVFLLLPNSSWAGLIGISFDDTGRRPSLVSNGRALYTRSAGSPFSPGRQAVNITLSYEDGSSNSISGFVALNSPARMSGPGTRHDGMFSAPFAGGQLKLFNDSGELLLSYGLGSTQLEGAFGSRSALLDASGSSVIHRRSVCPANSVLSALTRWASSWDSIA